MLIDMVDDFRYRCLQIWKSRNETVEDFSSTILFDYVMADALWHIQVTLEQWEDLPVRQKDVTNYLYELEIIFYNLMLLDSFLSQCHSFLKE